MATWKKLVVAGSEISQLTNDSYYLINSQSEAVLSGSFSGSFTGYIASASNALTASYVLPLTQPKVEILGQLQQGYTTASGDFAVSMGSGSVASGKASLATGQDSVAQGKYSRATGEISFAQGIATEAAGVASHAEGSGTKAGGSAAHAEGLLTSASGNYSHAEGERTVASGWNSHAEGLYTSASGLASHAEGSGSLAFGTGSHAEGRYTSASGNYSHAEGDLTVASGFGAHAEGQSSIASGVHSHAEGVSTEAYGQYSHAEGFTTVAQGLSSHAEGEYTNATGTGAHAEGYYTSASGDYSHAAGLYTTASADYSSVIGQYNIAVPATASFVIGNGNVETGSNLLYAHDNKVEITGSLIVSAGSITGSLFGTASYATTASYALNAGGGKLKINTVSGSDATGSIELLTQVLTLSGSANQIQISTSSLTEYNFKFADHVRMLTASIANDLTIEGNLTVNGTTTTINTTDLIVEDAFITIASGSIGTTDSGILVDRGTYASGSIAYGWDAGTKAWGYQNTITSSANGIDLTQAKTSARAGIILLESVHGALSGSNIETSEFQVVGAMYVSGSGEIWINV
jgi:hypothetical protein